MVPRAICSRQECELSFNVLKQGVSSITKGVLPSICAIWTSSSDALILMECRSIIGVNMLRIADYKPETLQYCMESVIRLLHEGKIDPHVGQLYKAENIYQAHEDMEARKTMGKIGITW